MSYEPILVIWHADLIERKSVIENYVWGLVPKKMDDMETRVYTALLKLCDAEPVSFHQKKVQLVLMHPVGSQYNSTVRRVLDHLKIEFQIDY